MTVTTDWAEFAARSFEPQMENRWASPGTLARHMDPQTVQTAALDLLDGNLVDVAEGRCPRLIWSMPPQEGKVNGPAAASPCGCWSAIPNYGSRSSPTNWALPGGGVARSATTSPNTPSWA